MLRQRFALTESQIQVLEHAADAIGQERRHRQELQRLNAMLHQLEQDKDLFTQMLVHDLKNSLAAQVGCLDLIRREPLTENQHLFLESAVRSSKNLSDVVANLLDISRLKEGRFELEYSLVPPHDLLNACAEELRGWIAEDYKTLEVVAAADLPLLHVDLRLIRRVLLNLLSNAIKHTPDGTNILLRASATSSQPAEGADAPTPRVTIEVTDTGLGIPAQDLDRIFEKYARVAGRAEGRYDGSGLGLTFCRLAVEAHGGAISVTSQVGVGTTFRLELPAR
jgi:signal transduction histidine kinase